jgi:uncharacterized damage-inducible protein DinB
MAINVLGLLRVQAANHFLANHRLMQACLRLDEMEYYATRQSFFGSIHGTFDHIVTTDQRYLSRLGGTPLPPTGDDGVTYGTRDALVTAQHETDAAMRAYIGGLSVDDLEQEILLHETDRWGRVVEPIWAILQHVLAHGTHHRGQIHDMLSQTSIAPPQLDEFFLRMDRDSRKEEVDAQNLSGWMIDAIH